MSGRSRPVRLSSNGSSRSQRPALTHTAAWSRCAALTLALAASLSFAQTGAESTPPVAAPVMVPVSNAGPGSTGPLVRPATAPLIELDRDPLGDVTVGELLTVVLRLHNTCLLPASYRLSDDPGALLTAHEPSAFVGTLAPGESRELHYQASVNPGTEGQTDELRASLSSDCSAAGSEQQPGTRQTAAAPVRVVRPAAQRPLAVRRSTVRVTVSAPDAAQSGQAPIMQAPTIKTLPSVDAPPFNAPPLDAQALLVAQRPPEGSVYQRGSSSLNGAALPDPLIGPSGTLYWTLSARGILSYDVGHGGALAALPRAALLALYPQGREQLFSGEFDPSDRAAARPLTFTGQPAENSGQIRLPPQGAVYRDRDQVTVVVEGPLGEALGLRINGTEVPDTLIGKRVDDPNTGLQRLEYVGVRLQVGENVLASGKDQVTLTLAGTTQKVQVLPEQTVADGVTPIRLRLRALDERGVSTGLQFLTLRSSPEPLTPDANPRETGFQLRLIGGEGVLLLPPQAAPVQVSIESDLGNGHPQRSTLDLTPGAARVGVGLLSVTLGASETGTPQFTATARASLETPLGGGRLIVAADTAGLPGSRDLPSSQGYSAYGDRSREQLPLQGQDPVAFQYDHPGFTAQYRQAPLPIQTVTVPGAPTALSVVTRTPVQVSAFGALVALSTREDLLTPDGTRLLRLNRQNIAPDSETVDIVTSDPLSGLLTPRRLTRGSDYALDALSGLLTLAAPLSRLDAQLRDVRVRVAYRLAGTGERVPAYGAEVRGSALLGNGTLSASAAIVRLPGSLTTAARLGYDSQPFQVSVLAAYSQGLLLDVTARASLGGATASFGVHRQEAGYAGLNAGGIGTYASAALSIPLTEALKASASTEYQGTPDGAAGRSGSVAGGLEYSQRPFTVSAGLRATLGDAPGLSATARFGYHAAPLDLDLTHAQPLSGDVGPLSTLSVRVQLPGGVALVAQDQLTWGLGDRASLGLESRLGAANYALSYELPGEGGAGNRARFGADTLLALGERLSLNLSGAYLYGLGTSSAELNASGTLRYQSETASASGSADFSLAGGILRTVLRGGAALTLNEKLNLSADALSEFGPTRGDRFSVGAALRDGPWQALGSLRYGSGSLANGVPALTAQADVEYHLPGFALRAGLAARQRLDDPLSLTVQPSLSGTGYLTSRFGLGGHLRASLQPGSGTALVGAGLEGSFRALPGTWVSLGYNLMGFDSVTSAITRAGPYLRLDITLDEAALPTGTSPESTSTEGR